ncbi:ArnT family glycosyltransferase [Tautonia rosea]|uniref:ArnT family glycosyltransferase n=1 Tax=Tautonia rosea TaxID=2728037 RepID=UPI001474E739|nr:glycosyltransferase family 39 protein [Tautonia rosea]
MRPPYDCLTVRNWAWIGVCLMAAALGLGLLIHGLGQTSATYDEVAYLELAAHWWRTGDLETIGRMGSPMTFLRLQQAPTLWVLDLIGRGDWIDDPITHQAALLPVLRLGALWIWLAAFLVTAFWARRVYGPNAAAMAALIFAFSPNLLAHGGLITMELPLLLFWIVASLLFARFLESGDRRMFLGSAVAAGVAFSCKFTTILLPPILALAWVTDRLLLGDRRPIRLVTKVGGGMMIFGIVLLATDLIITGFATISPSARVGASHPALDGRFGPRVDPWLVWLSERKWPQDYVALGIQMLHQRSGGVSYLLGERRMQGWWYYYVIAMSVKVPLGFWLLAGGRMAASLRQLRLGWRKPTSDEVVIGVTLVTMLVLTALGSKRNYGLRYLLPLAPLAIVWVSKLAESARPWRKLAAIGLIGQVVAVASIHPYELSYFNILGGGPVGGRHILADSNLDWGQGARSLARIQHEEPIYHDLTTYYFGDTDPAYYGVIGTRHIIDAGAIQPNLPDRFAPSTRFVAVSASLQHGPWGPDDYFRVLDEIVPDRLTDDGTIAIYRIDAIRTERETSGSEEVATAGQSVLQPIGKLGDVLHDTRGIGLIGHFGGEVANHNVVLLPAQNLDGKVSLNRHGVELQQGRAVSMVGRTTDRDEGNHRPPIAVRPDITDVDRLPTIGRHGHNQPVAVPGRVDLITTP